MLNSEPLDLIHETFCLLAGAMKVDAATKGKLEKVKYFLEEEKIDPNIRQPDLVIQKLFYFC